MSNPSKGFTQEFVETSQHLIVALEKLRPAHPGKNGLGELIDEILENVRGLHEQAKSKTLPRSGGSRLCLGKSLGEWAPQDVCDLGRKLDDLFETERDFER